MNKVVFSYIFLPFELASIKQTNLIKQESIRKSTCNKYLVQFFIFRANYFHVINKFTRYIYKRKIN